MTTELASPPSGGQGAEGTPPASPPAAPPPPPAEGAPPAEPKPYYSEFKKPELRGYAEKKGWPDPETAIESYMNLEKFHGVPADRLVKLPENMDDAEAIAPILARLGYTAPAEAKEYGFADMEGANPQQAEALSAIAHKHGVPAKLASAVFKDVIALEASQREAAMTEVTEEVAVEMGQLRGEWMGKYDENLEKGRRAVRHLGFSEEELQAIETSTGAGNLFRRFKEVHDKLGLGESGFVEGQPKKGDNGLSPAAARSEIARLRDDKEFGGRLLNRDAAALERWTRLNQIAASDQGPGVIS